MIVQMANERHVQGIVDVCTRAYRITSQDFLTKEYIDRRCEEFFNEKRVHKEVTEHSPYWGGYFVALEGACVIGTGGGGMTGQETGELFVLYIEPDRRNEGIGSKILQAITEQQKGLGAKEQWVSVQKDNALGIPFYEARGFIFQKETQSYESNLEDNAISLRYKREI
ncbi:GNAT family N-acetyltransferase [Oceanobacillus chungangensis]|uniref:GNAT family N-acetyltransferase n=1 Tax=Oceanobacillus chungangensis TaxID=1229152 RepID=UPI0026989521